MKTLKQKYEDSQKNSLRTQYELREKLKLVESKLLLNEKLDNKAIKEIGDVLTRIRAIGNAFQNEYLTSVINNINRDLNSTLKSSGAGKVIKNKLGFADNLKRALGAVDALENGFSQLPFLVKNALQSDLAELVAAGAVQRAAASEEDKNSDPGSVDDTAARADRVAKTDPTLLAISNAVQEKEKIQKPNAKGIKAKIAKTFKKGVRGINTKEFRATIAKAFQPSKDWMSVFKLGHALQYSYFDATKLATEVLKTKVSVLLKTIEVATNAKNQSKSEDATIANAVAKESPNSDKQDSGNNQKSGGVEQLAKDLNLNDADKFKVQKWYDFFKDRGLIK